jgi:DNA sulfur modification protein DndC
VEELNLVVETKNGEYKQLGLGPFTLKAREMILRKLLQTQKRVRELHDPSIELISKEELKMIRKCWMKDGDWEDRVPLVVLEETGEMLDWEYDDRPMFQKDQITDLERLCQEYNVNLSLIQKLIAIEKEYVGYKIRRGLQQEFEKVLNQDYLHI